MRYYESIETDPRLSAERTHQFYGGNPKMRILQQLVDAADDPTVQDFLAKQLAAYLDKCIKNREARQFQSDLLSIIKGIVENSGTTAIMSITPIGSTSFEIETDYGYFTCGLYRNNESPVMRYEQRKAIRYQRRAVFSPKELAALRNHRHQSDN